MLLVALLVVAVGFAWCLHWARRLIRAPTLTSLPLAFMIAVSTETVIMNTLSLFHAVTRLGVLGSHVFLLACWLATALRTAPREKLARFLRRMRGRFAVLARSPTAWLLVPLVAMLWLVSLRYPPNNFDSLTYHLGRVAHWLDYRSIAFFPTTISRQNETGPGAEYLILVLQAITDSDVLASAVQTTAYVIVVLSIATIVRYLRAPRPLGVALVVLFATTPPFVLQATSTQNDLCASVGTLAILSTLRDALVGRTSPGLRGGAALGIAMAGAYLVKPTAILFAVPFFLIAAIQFARRFLGSPGRAARDMIVAGVATLLVAATLCGPHLLRKRNYHGVTGQTETEVIYPLAHDWVDPLRLLNPIWCAPHHLMKSKVTEAIGDLYKRVSAAYPADPKLATRNGRINGFYVGHAGRFYEDMIGAPIQFGFIGFATFAAMVAVPFVRSWRRRPLLVGLGFAPLVGWFVFGWICRNNLWIARYHLPWFATGVFSCIFLCRQAARHRIVRVVVTAGTGVAALASLGYAWAATSDNEMRPISARVFFSPIDRKHEWYAFHVAHLEKEHARVLDEAERRHCDRIAIVTGDDEVEYPLVWAARKRGMRVDNAAAGLDDACLVYAPSGRVPHGDKDAWKPLSPTEKKVFLPEGAAAVSAPRPPGNSAARLMRAR